MHRRTTHDHRHLTLEERKIIQVGIENRCNKVDISRTIAKDPTTVAKEIRNHRKIRLRNVNYYPIICKHLNECRSKCKFKCSRYEEKKCKNRDRSPGACNKCPKMQSCHLDKYFYVASVAHESYLKTLVDAREGIRLTTKERDNLANILKPLLDNGQSIYQILSSHPEITQCEATIYNYINDYVFKDNGIDFFSLKEKVQRKSLKKYRVKKEPVNYEGRKYDDYQAYHRENPNVPTVQMDTVYNNPSGPYIQTFIFEGTSFMIGVLHLQRTSESMGQALDVFEEKLEFVLFTKLFPLILSDRGSEFSKWKYFEANTETGVMRLRIFYCDPMNSSQKPHVENNHNYIRDIIPNGYDISNITQEDLDLMFSHINSTPRAMYNGRTPYEMMEFLHKDDFEMIRDAFNIKQIKRDDVTLKPHLLSHVYKRK